jgi:hypothetical protein
MQTLAVAFVLALLTSVSARADAPRPPVIETARSGADCQRAAPSDPSPGTITITGIDDHVRPEIAITLHRK